MNFDQFYDRNRGEDELRNQQAKDQLYEIDFSSKDLFSLQDKCFLDEQLPPQPQEIINDSTENSKISSTPLCLPNLQPQTDAPHTGSVETTEEMKIKEKKERLKEKREKAKNRQAMKVKAIEKKKEEELECKKEVQQMRNRLSAQKSRDRKKKESEELRVENDRLRKENISLHVSISEANKELSLFHKIVDSFSTVCFQEYTRLRQRFSGQPTSTSNNEDTTEEFTGRPSGGRSSSPLFLTTLVLGTFCLIACMTPILYNSSINPLNSFSGEQPQSQSAAVSHPTPKRLLVSEDAAHTGSGPPSSCTPLSAGTLIAIQASRKKFLCNNKSYLSTAVALNKENVCHQKVENEKSSATPMNDPEESKAISTTVCVQEGAQVSEPDQAIVNYHDSDSEGTCFASDEEVYTVFTDNAYFFSDGIQFPASIEKQGDTLPTNTKKKPLKHIQLMIPAKGIKFLGEDGKMISGYENSEDLLELGCTVFEVTRIPGV